MRIIDNLEQFRQITPLARIDSCVEAIENILTTFSLRRLHRVLINLTRGDDSELVDFTRISYF